MFAYEIEHPHLALVFSFFCFLLVLFSAAGFSSAGFLAGVFAVDRVFVVAASGDLGGAGRLTGSLLAVFVLEGDLLAVVSVLLLAVTLTLTALRSRTAAVWLCEVDKLTLLFSEVCMSSFTFCSSLILSSLTNSSASLASDPSGRNGFSTASLLNN